MTKGSGKEELAQRQALVIEEYGGILPYAQVFYTLSIEYAARAAVAAFSEYRQLDPDEASHSRMVSLIHDGLGHCASISRFFWPSHESNKLAMARAENLRRLLAVDDDSPLKNRALRNALEHFDERLDRFMLGDVAGHILPQAIIGPHALADEPTAKIFKLVDPEDDVFVLLNEKFEFGPLAAEASRILLLTDGLL